MICVIISLNILVLHVTKLDMLIITIGIITIATGMLGTIFGTEIVIMKKECSFH